MTARWMQQKVLKRARERRAWARPYSIKNSAGPNWHNGTQARETPADPDAFLNEERAIAREQATRKPHIPALKDVITDDYYKFFVTVVDTPYHRCRVYWGSGMESFTIQYILYFQRKIQVSIAYPTFTRANFAFQNSKVRWKLSRVF